MLKTSSRDGLLEQITAQQDHIAVMHKRSQAVGRAVGSAVIAATELSTVRRALKGAINRATGAEQALTTPQGGKP